MLGDNAGTKQGVVNQIGTEKTFYVMEYNQFDRLASLYLGREYEFVEAHEANNYSSYQFQITDLDIAHWREHRPTGPIRSPREVLTAMIGDGILQPGNYLIEVYW